MEVITPSGCRWCGVPERGHGDRLALGRGVHVYDAPEQWQIKARMRQRRAAARQQCVHGVPGCQIARQHSHHWCTVPFCETTVDRAHTECAEHADVAATELAAPS